jgi:hypothetical protein
MVTSHFLMCFAKYGSFIILVHRGQGTCFTYKKKLLS